MAESQMIKVPKDAKVKLSPEEKCRAQGGIWNGKECIFSTQKATEQQTEQTLPPTTQRELIELQKEQAAVSAAEARKKAEFDKQKAEADLDKPLGAGIDLTKPTETSTEQQTEQDLGKKIKFLQDGTIEYSMGGETVILTKDEYNTLQGKGGMITENVARAREFKTEQQLQQEQSLQMGMEAGQLNEQNLMQQAQQAEVSYVDAFFKAVPSMLPDLAQIVGGAALAVFTGGTAAGVGYVGIANGVRGVYSDIIREIEIQKGEFSGSQEQQLEEGKQVLNDILSATNAGAVSPSDASAKWNRQLSSIRQSYYNLKRQQINNKYIGDDLTQEIREFEIYFEGEYAVQYDEFLLSLMQPDPTKIRPTEEQKQRILNKIKNSNQ